MNWPKLLKWIFFSLLITWIIGGALMWFEADYQCKEECELKGGLYTKLVHNGEYNINDDCMCFFDDHIEVFKIG